MYGFRIIITVEENENGFHQNNAVESLDGKPYNTTIVLGALANAMASLPAEIEKE